MASITAPQTKTGYSTLQITLHWVIAAIVLFQLVLGESMTAYVDSIAESTAVSPFDTNVATLHYYAGISILVLVAVRLAIRLYSGVPAAPVTSNYWMELAAKASHGLFYALLVAVPVTGLLGYYFEGPYGDIHSWAKPVFIGLIAIHAAAALFHQFWLKDGTLTRILKPAKSTNA
jgi:cytochrome b561